MDNKVWREHQNFKLLVLALLKSYRHHLLRDDRHRLGAGFGMIWGWIWMVLGWFGGVFVVFLGSSFIKDHPLYRIPESPLTARAATTAGRGELEGFHSLCFTRWMSFLLPVPGTKQVQELQDRSRSFRRGPGPSGASPG